MRQDTEAVVFEGDELSSFFPKKILEFYSWLALMVDEIPEEYRATANIEICDRGCDECSNIGIKIYYIRPETDAEMESREQADVSYKEEVVKKELRTLAALKAKYEQP